MLLQALQRREVMTFAAEVASMVARDGVASAHAAATRAVSQQLASASDFGYR